MKIVKAKLASHIVAKDYISIQKLGEEWPSQCIPLCVGETLLLSLSFRDFLPDGYEIIPLNQITGITRSEADMYFGEIVKKEGVSDFIDNAPQIDLTDWEAVFHYFMETKEIASVDVGDGCMDIGKIKAVFPDGIEIRRFDASGVWEKDNWYDSYDCITKVEARSHYIKTFSKYLPPE